MIIYDRSKKTLFIPSGLGNLNSENSADYNSGYTAGYTDGRRVQESVDLGKLTNTAITQNGMYIADYGFSVVDVNVESGDCSAAIAEAFQSGYTEGHAAGEGEGYTQAANDIRNNTIVLSVSANGSYSADVESSIYFKQVEVNVPQASGSCVLENGSYELDPEWDGTPMTITPESADGFNSFTIQDGAGGYGDARYDDGYLDGVEDGFADGYSSGYTAGQEDCPECSGSCNLQSKNVEVNTSEMAVVPDSGYDGFSSIWIDATTYGNSKYSEGYADGQSHCPPSSACALQPTIITVSQGEQTFYPDQGYDGFLYAHVDATSYGDSMAAIGYANGEAAGFADGHQSGYTDGYGDGYSSGYTDGQAQCSGSSCNLQVGSYDMDGNFAGASGAIYPDAGYDGFSSFEVNDEGYGAAKENQGFNTCQQQIRNKALVLSVSANGVYTANTGSDYFYKEVNVNVDTAPAFQSGYTSGYTDGFNTGYSSGHTDGVQSGYTEGYNNGMSVGQELGYGLGFTAGHQSGYTDGYGDGYSSGYTDGRSTNCRMQEKSITLTSPYTSVEPDFGYAGLSYVSINGGSLYYNGYNAGSAHGYSIGYDDGYSNGNADGWNSGRQSGFTDGYASGYTDGYGDGYLSGISATDCSEAAAEAYELGHQSGYTDGWNSGYTNGYTNGKAGAYKEGEQSVIKSFLTGNDIGYDIGGAIGHDDYGLVIAYYYTPQGQNCVITGYHRDCDERWDDAFDSMSVDGGSWQAPTLSYWLSQGWHQIRFRVKDKYLHYAFCHNFPTTPDTGYMDAIVAVSLPESASTQSGITGLVGTFIDNTSIRILSSSLNSINSGTAQSQGSIYGATNLNVIFSHYQGNENVAITPVAASGVLFYPQGKSSTHANAASGWTHIELF